MRKRTPQFRTVMESDLAFSAFYLIAVCNTWKHIRVAALEGAATKTIFIVARSLPLLSPPNFLFR